MTWQAQSMHCFRILPFCLNFVERGIPNIHISINIIYILNLTAWLFYT